MSKQIVTIFALLFLVACGEGKQTSGNLATVRYGTESQECGYITQTKGYWTAKHFGNNAWSNEVRTFDNFSQANKWLTENWCKP